MRTRALLQSPALVAALAGCAAGVTTPQQLITGVDARSVAALSTGATAATATLHNVAGEEIGAMRLVEDAQGRVHVTVHAKNLTPGLHGMHLHAIGVCDGSTTPAFASAGGHFNPTGKEHGHHNPAGYHSGDLPNLAVNGAGAGRLNVALEQFRLAELFDTDGTAVVIHANEDDLRTNSGPAGPGNSGARIACGILKR